MEIICTNMFSNKSKRQTNISSDHEKTLCVLTKNTNISVYLSNIISNGYLWIFVICLVIFPIC